jgi:hypothetical protein
LRPIASLACRLAAFSIIGTLAAACSGTGTSSVGTVPNTASTQTTTRGNASAERLASEGLVRPPAHAANTRPGWISPDAKRHKKPSLIYWGDYGANTIDIFPAKGVNPKMKGQITTGLDNPERLFVDAKGNVYATNIGNNTITAYKPHATKPFLTISNGVDGPTGLTVDSAGTVYCANVDNDTVTEYPKGQLSPSVTLNVFAEYLAVDSSDDLYVSGASAVTEFAPGTSSGKNLNLTIGSPGALEVDKHGNIIIIDDSANTIDVFPAGQVTPSKTIAVTAGTAFALSLNEAENAVYASVLVSGGFIVQDVAYPNGSTLKSKLTTVTDGDWPIAVSPDAVL